MTTLLHAPPADPPAAAAQTPAPSHRQATTPPLAALIDASAGVLPPVRRLGAFVGLSPMAGLEHLPFEAATVRSSAVLGGRRTPAEEVMRAAYASGRITDAHLTAAVVDAAPWVAEGSITLNGRAHALLEIVRDDLTAGPIDGTPSRARRTLAEALAAPIAAQIDRRTSRWCAAYYDAGEAGWPMPHRARGLYGSWRSLAPHEPGMPRRLRRAVRNTPTEALRAIEQALDTLGVPDGEYGPYVEAHLGALPGWSAFAHHVGSGRGSDLADLLAIRLVQEAALLAPRAWRPSLSASAPLSTQVPTEERAAALLHRLGFGTTQSLVLAELTALLGSVPRRDLIWLTAYEAAYRDDLLRTLREPPPAAQQSVDAQIVCCIDARSEGLRRALDSLHRYETHGFAGFFGLPMQLQLDDGRVIAQCPVPITPSVTVAEEQPASGATAAASLREAAGAALHAAHQPGAGAFMFAEAAGAIAAPRAALRTTMPGLAARRPGDGHAPVRAHGLSTEALIDHAASIVGSLGLSLPLAPLLVLCGHESTTANNPYAAALQCGACGGNSGESNARAVATLLNDPEVRAGLAARGLSIPQHTWVLAAVHDTTTDRVRLLATDEAPARFHGSIARLEGDLTTAAARLQQERRATLPATPHGAPAARSGDWAQPFPEWGLAGNAALVIAPQERVRGRNLGRRTFLHTYNPSEDRDGSLLETILTAPVVVAHGLNAQYYGAAVDPQHLGSGTKAVHNVVGGVGVTAAAGGDLLIGLPWQSVADGDWLAHEPMRLLVLIEAPRQRVDRILANHPSVAQLVEGGWLSLLCRESSTDGWHQRNARGWQPVSPATGRHLSSTSNSPHKEPVNADR